MAEQLRLMPETVDEVRELAAKAHVRHAEAVRGAEVAQHVDEFLRSLATYAAKAWSLHIVSLVDGSAEAERAARTIDPDAARVIAGVLAAAREASKQLLRSYPGDLEIACREAALPLNLRESRHPRYYFEGRYFVLEIDDRKGVARLGDYEGLLTEFPADIGAVVENVRSERDRVFGRKFSWRSVLALVRREYETELKRQRLEPGAAVPIRRLSHRLGKTRRGFRTDEFFYDLARLIKEGATRSGGFVLDLQQTKDTRNGVLLPGLEERGYVGFIIFKRS